MTAGLPEFDPKSKNERYLLSYKKTTTISRDKALALVKKYLHVQSFIDLVTTTVVAGIKLNKQEIRE